MLLHEVKQNQVKQQNTMALEFAEQSKILRKIDRLQRRMAAIPARAGGGGRRRLVPLNRMMKIMQMEKVKRLKPMSLYIGISCRRVHKIYLFYGMNINLG